MLGESHSASQKQRGRVYALNSSCLKQTVLTQFTSITPLQTRPSHRSIARKNVLRLMTCSPGVPPGRWSSINANATRRCLGSL